MSIMSLRRDTQASGEGTAGQKKLRQETEPAGTLGSNPDKAGRGSSVIWGCFGPGSSQQKDGCEHSACEGRTPPGRRSRGVSTTWLGFAWGGQYL